MKTALISVSNKEGIVDFAKELSKLGIRIISTGNTAKALNEKGIKTITVSDVTKFPEMLDGRLKTLHPKIFGGVLADRGKAHAKQMKEQGIENIDIVVVNFYPFEETIKKTEKIHDIIENIDIGGPALVRAAAKNHDNVVVVVDPSDYGLVIAAIKAKKITTDMKQKLAAKAFQHTARYDTIIARYMSENFLNEKFPEIFNFTFRKMQDLRYGENPDQKAAFYKSF